MYLTICNNPRAKRFLREETILVAVIPGPREPSLEELNEVLEPMVRAIKTLYSGTSSLDFIYKPFLMKISRTKFSCLRFR